jgi:hypothetical protein
MMKDFPEALCGHEAEMYELLEDWGLWDEFGPAVCHGITGPMIGGTGNPCELADYYLTNIHESQPHEKY